jgi:PAS domain S-box-containing protein
MRIFNDTPRRGMNDFLGAGEMPSLIRDRDWANTPLGAFETWPQSLRTAVDLMLHSRSAMFVWWGRELLNLYNDAYRPFLGGKHPDALGRSARDIWPEIWDFVGSRAAAVLDDGESTFDEAMLLIMERHGYPEATYFTFSYSPIYDDKGAVGGIFGVVTDETSHVVGERRLKLLSEVSVRIAQTNVPEEICEAATARVGSDAQDLPFALIYLIDSSGSTAHLVARTGIAAEHPAAAQSIDLADIDSVWPLGRAKDLNDRVLVKDLQERFESLPMGAWNRPPSQAVVLPLSDQRQSVPFGFLVAGLSPYLLFDEVYGGFLGLLVGQIAGGLTNARLFEQERAHAEARHLAMVAENELRRAAQLAQERAEVILASISDGFLAVDHEWRFTYVNVAAEKVMGRSSSEVIGKDYWTEYPAGVDIERETNLRHAMDNRVSVAYESYFHQLSIWLDVRVYPATDGGLAIYFRNITEKKRAEDSLRQLNDSLEVQVAQRTAELQAQQARLRTIFETSYTNQGVLSLDGILVDVNATALEGVAVKRDAVIGRPFWETPWFTGTPGVPEMVRDAIPRVANGETARQEIFISLPVGGWRWYDFQMRPVHDEEGMVVALVAEASDLTARRKAEEALRQAQKMEAIGQLTGGVAHDFNNLLQVISGNLDLLKRLISKGNFSNSDLLRLIENGNRGVRRGATLTQKLLAFSRRQPLAPRSIEPNRLITRVSELLRNTLGESINIETVLAGGLWHIFSDADELESALLNLAVNARDAMPQGGRLTIETANAHLDDAYVSAQEELSAGQYVMIAVSDTGMGMAEEVIARAFEPFFTTKESGQGTGLGLSQVYGFVKQTGGHVRIYSEQNEGTTVKIYLPRFLGEDRKSTDQITPSAVPLATEEEVILVVEDDEEVRINTVKMLSELGYQVLEVSDGPNALRVLNDRPDIDLLFTDVGLPGGLNGRQLADRARILRPDLRVLFTSGYARNAIVHQGRLDPGVELLSKPFTLTQLAAKIRQMLII